MKVRSQGSVFWCRQVEISARNEQKLAHEVSDLEAELFGQTEDQAVKETETKLTASEPPTGGSFLSKQHAQLLTMAAKRRLKLDGARVGKRGLAEAAKAGLRTSIGRLKVKYFRMCGSMKKYYIYKHIWVT